MTVDIVRIRRIGAQGDQMIAVMPVELDIANADQVREALLRALNGGVSTLIIDMSGTTFCDVAGVHVFERVYQRARTCGAELRMVVTAPIVRRVLTLNGLHRIIAIYPSVRAVRSGPRSPWRGPQAPRAGACGWRRARFTEE